MNLLTLLDVSIADAVELEQNVNHSTSNFSDGKLDGINNFEPVAYQWFNSDYRKGYLVGVIKRISTKYTDMERKNYVSLS